MTEIEVSSEGVMDLAVVDSEKTTTTTTTTTKKKTEEEEEEEDGSSATVVRWDRFLPRMVLRVLLVESDDSTRQIIAALLRKCSYKVAAVSDGLKAWEVLRKRSHNIDLIMTEVDLPSISGFALLTLIMEHEMCKHIPVIMMSSSDSISTVYNCMLRGAADFLVKPVRKNELKNLWQHVWRRQATTAGGQPQDESVAQQKAEATAENNTSSNQSSGYMACSQRNEDYIEKGNDAQSSCTKPDMVADCIGIGYTENPSELKWTAPENDLTKQKHEKCVDIYVPDNNVADVGSASTASKDANVVVQDKEMELRIPRKHANIIVEACENYPDLGNSFMGAISLIGAIDNNPGRIHKSSGSVNGTNKIDSSDLLNLSLRRSHPSDSVNQVTDERQMLHHSDASAFSRYVNRTLQPPDSASASLSNQQKEHLTTCEKLSNDVTDCNSNGHGTMLSTQKNIAVGQSGRAEMSFPYAQQKVMPLSDPSEGVRFENVCATYYPIMSPIFCSGLSSMQIPGPTVSQEPSFQPHLFYLSNDESINRRHFHDLHDQNANMSSNQTEFKQWYKSESFEERRHCFSATDQSANSSFCDGAAGHHTSIGGSNDNSFPVPVAGVSGNEANIVHDGNSHRSIQREAALNKFRLKRKERCYEKKVRYESRKKLAEQRPRVKGQFVRHIHNVPPTVETESRCGNSVGDWN